MIANSKEYWVGEFYDGEIVIFAPEYQRSQEKDWVYLWSNESCKVERYARDIARMAIRKPVDSRKANAVLAEFVERRNSEKEIAKKAAADRENQLTQQLVQRHRARLEALGLPYQGVTETGRAHRITHCWQCKGHLDNSVDLECKVCNWILCVCGACGCGRDIDRTK